MPFRETDRVKERRELVEAWESGLYNKSELARRFGVTRPTVHLWVARAEADEPLTDRSRAPHECPHRTDAEIAEELIAFRKLHRHWGPKKIGDALRRGDRDKQWPADSTIGDVLKRADLIEPRRRRPQIERSRERPAKESEPGLITTVDFKGQFRLGDRKYCYPLTVADPVSRFIYAIEAMHSTSYVLVREVMERVFRRHGLPEIVLSDNGVPFCTRQGVVQYSRLGVWCLRYGVQIRHTRPGHPEDNAVHERMHRTLKAETTRPPKRMLSQQQRAFDDFRRQFNRERSHEGIGRKVPADVHRRSPREFPKHRPEPDYPGHFEIRRVSDTGTFSWGGSFIYLSSSFAGEHIGLEEVDDAIWSIRFFEHELARFDERSKTLR
jgi:putative transposase